MIKCPDHPEIVWIMNTGYPSYKQPETIRCQECGADITDEEVYEDEFHKYLCEDCLLFFHKLEKW